MKITRKIEVQEVKSKLIKTFIISVNVSVLRRSLVNYLKSVDERNPSYVTAKRLVINLFEDSISRADDASSKIIHISFPDQTSVAQTLDMMGMINPINGRCTAGQLLLIPGYIKIIFSFWLYKVGVEGLISAERELPTIDIFSDTNFVYEGVLKGLNDIEILAVIGSSVVGLKKGLKNNIFSEKFRVVVSNLIYAYEESSGSKDIPYKPNATSVLRAYLISGKWDREVINIEDLVSVKNQLNIQSKNSIYSLRPLIDVLVHYAYVNYKGSKFTASEFDIYLKGNEFFDKDVSKEMTRRRNLSQAKLAAEILKDSQFSLDETYKTLIYGNLQCKGVIEDHVVFLPKRDDTPIRFANDGIEIPETTFDQLISYQNDFLKNQLGTNKIETVKNKKSHLKLLNNYLCGYLYQFSFIYKHKFLDCSKDNFIKTNLALVFTESELVVKKFEEEYDLKLLPMSFKSWLEKVGEIDKKSGNSIHRLLRDCLEFFQFCSGLASQLGGTFNNPLPNNLAKTYSNSYKVTAKEVFEFFEWIVWNELIKACLEAVVELYESKVSGTQKSVSQKEILDCFANIQGFEVVERLFNVSVTLDADLVSNADNNYKKQYDNFWTDKKTSAIKPFVFANILAAIFVMTRCGIRCNSAVNLPFDDLIVKQFGDYTSINVIADKVSDSGFESLILTESLDLVLRFRKAACALSEVDYERDRTFDRTDGYQEKFRGLFGANRLCDEDKTYIVCDFFFYLFNEFVGKINGQFERNILTSIPLRMYPKFVSRGTNDEYLDKNYKADAYMLPIERIKEAEVDNLAYFVAPACLVNVRPNRTVHSLRATFVTNNFIAGVNSTIIGYFTGQKPRTVGHYVKASLDNVTMFEEQGAFKFMEKMLKGEISPFTESSSEEVIEAIKGGIVKSNGIVCSSKTSVDMSKLDTIYREGHKHIAINPTHLCPYNNECPPDIRRELDHKKDCAICPVSVSFVWDIPAINQKIHFHISEGQTIRSQWHSTESEKHKKELHGRFMTHYQEATKWLIRYDMLVSNNKPVAGGRIFDDGKRALLEYKCEDNELLDNLLTMLETRDSFAYQSQQLKERALSLQYSLIQNFEKIEIDKMVVNPVEAVCGTIQKLLAVNNIALPDLLNALQSNHEPKKLGNLNTLLIGAKNGQA